jgi:hypothetical protein
MTGIGWQIALVLVLMVANAAFAGSEVALISLREGQLRRLEAEGGRGRLVARLAGDPNQFLSTVQIGITLAVTSTVTRPLVWLLSRSTDLLVRLAGGDPDAQPLPPTSTSARRSAGWSPAPTPGRRCTGRPRRRGRRRPPGRPGRGRSGAAGYGLRTILVQSSSLLRNSSKPRGASSRGMVWLRTKLGSISPLRIRSRSGRR